MISEEELKGYIYEMAKLFNCNTKLISLLTDESIRKVELDDYNGMIATTYNDDKIEISIPYIMFLINKILFKTYTRNEIDILIDKKIKELENNGHKTKGHAPIFLVAIDIFNKEFL